MAMLKRALAALMLVLAVAPCSGQHGPRTSSGVELYPGCGCLGDNSKLGADELGKHGQDYGKFCAAWDDDKCMPNATVANDLGQHSCNGTIAATCKTHWPSKDFSQNQDWCCDSWCYVSNETCTAEQQAVYGIKLALSWTGKGLYYSYEACQDEWTAPRGYNNNDEFTDAQKNVVSYSQYTKASCPYYKAPPPSPSPAPPANGPTSSASTPVAPAYVANKKAVVRFAVDLKSDMKTFDGAMQTKYKIAIAAAAGAGVSSFDVKIVKVAAPTKRRYSHTVIRVDTDVMVADKAFGASVTEKLTIETIQSRLADNGVANAGGFSKDNGVSQNPKVLSLEEAASSASSVLASLWLTTLAALSVAISSNFF